MTIDVEGHALVSRMGGRCTEIRRGFITAPIGTRLVTITRESGNEEAGVERMITDQQLVGVSVVCGSQTVPQSISTCSIPIVTCGRYGLVGLSLEVSLASRLVINEDYFCELK